MDTRKTEHQIFGASLVRDVRKLSLPPRRANPDSITRCAARSAVCCARPPNGGMNVDQLSVSILWYLWQIMSTSGRGARGGLSLAGCCNLAFT